MLSGLVAILLAFTASLAAAQTAPDLHALLAARSAPDTQDVRDKLLKGDMPEFVADLLARAHAGDARRWVLVEVVERQVVTLLVDDGEHSHVYRRSSSWSASMGYDNAKLVRAVPAAQADRLWREFERHPSATPAASAAGVRTDVIGFARLHDADGDRWRLLQEADVASYHKATATADLLCSTLLAGLDCRPGNLHRVNEWFGAWTQALSELPPSASEKRDDALWVAVRAGDWARAKSLVDAGADPKAFASDGDSIAHWAAAHHDPDIDAHLALLGADPKQATFFGVEPELFAH